MKNKITKEMLEEYIIKKEKIPILIIDKIWLDEFPKEKNSKEINDLENEIKTKMKEEGNLNNEVDELNKTKKQNIKEIIFLTNKLEDENFDAHSRMQKLNKNIEMQNRVISKNTERLHEVPKEINDLNMELLEETLNVCYNRLRKSEKKVTELSAKLHALREELRQTAAEKADWDSNYKRNMNLLNSIAGKKLFDFLEEKIEKDN